MIKICHLADVHLGLKKYSKLTKTGFNQREFDIALAFREVIDQISVIKPNLTIIAGDLFHSVRPSNAALTQAFREIRRLSSVSKVVIISGNHEAPKRADVGNILRLFSEIPDVYVADMAKTQFNFGEFDLSITALPHPSLMDENLNIQANDKYKFNVLVAHGQIGDTWISEFGGIERKISDLNIHQFDYVALGHIHVVKQVEFNTWYSGAIEHTSSNIWSESKEPKGFLEVTLQNAVPKLNVKFRSLKSPREVIQLSKINASLIADIDSLVKKIKSSLDEIPGGIEGKLVRLEVFNIPKEIYRLISHKEFKEYKAQALHLQLELKQEIINLADLNSLNSSTLKLPLLEQLVKFTKDYKKDSSINVIEKITDKFNTYFRTVEEAKDEVN